MMTPVFRSDTPDGALHFLAPSAALCCFLHEAEKGLGLASPPSKEGPPRVINKGYASLNLIIIIR